MRSVHFFLESAYTTDMLQQTLGVYLIDHTAPGCGLDHLKERIKIYCAPMKTYLLCDDILPSCRFRPDAYLSVVVDVGVATEDGAFECFAG